MNDMMQFPKDIYSFLLDYSFIDDEQVYTNESLLIPTSRVKQAIEHYFERPKGKWIEHPHERGLDWEDSMFECSECHEWTDSDYSYCPNCGAYMSGGEKE